MREVAAQLQADKAAVAEATEVARYDACALRQPDEPRAVGLGCHLEVLLGDAFNNNARGFWRVDLDFEASGGIEGGGGGGGDDRGRGNSGGGGKGDEPEDENGKEGSGDESEDDTSDKDEDEDGDKDEDENEDGDDGSYDGSDV